ncbi:MAG: hypothetical protein K2W78_15125 [Xanthobacteraceae bacterium]|nr:hypothetical protein [Xanthobacteraceae bacterium]
MAISTKTERSLVSHDEFETLSKTHQPALSEIDDGTLASLQKSIRDLRAKERTLVREIRRGISGRKDTRGGSFPGNAERPARRKQVFAGALKRLNGELTRRRAHEARQVMKASLEQALERKRKAPSKRFPVPGWTADGGMKVKENKRPRKVLDPANVGRASATTKVAQARKNARPTKKDRP